MKTGGESVDVFGEGYSWHNVHGLQFLEQKLTSVGDLYGGNVSGRLAVVAPRDRERGTN